VARLGIKVLYMSGYADDAIVHHGTLAPGTHFIGKPFSAADLARRVREVLEDGVANAIDRHEQG
jgi:FixJ family two-component response regulator